jgi:hypothetical protein
MAKQTYWAQNFGPLFNPLEGVDWKAFGSSSSEEVEEAIAKVLEACVDARYSYELKVKQHGKWICVDLSAKLHWWALEDDLFDEVSCFVQEWTKCSIEEYKAFKN